MNLHFGGSCALGGGGDVVVVIGSPGDGEEGAQEGEYFKGGGGVGGEGGVDLAVVVGAVVDGGVGDKGGGLQTWVGEWVQTSWIWM